MKIAFFDTHDFEKKIFEKNNSDFKNELVFFEPRLTKETARLASGFPVVCAFVSDQLDRQAIEILRSLGVKLIALRSAGYNHVDLCAAKEAHIKVVRVPEYSPYAVAEHAVALILTLNRKIHRAYNRVKELNFTLEGLVGFDLHGKTVGIIGTGRIGSAAARILRGFGCKVLAYDIKPNEKLAEEGIVAYVSLDQLLTQSKIISLHVPLNKQTFHLINAEALSKTQKHVMLINTGRGGIIDTRALITFLKSGHIGAAGLDVYEEEENIFFEDLSQSVLQDDVLARLLTFPNVVITSHQGFLTQEALTNIARTTFANIQNFERGMPLENEVKLD